jgi:flagellar protein FlbD
MIELTRLNGDHLLVNPDHIRFVEICPDTLVTFMDGRTLMVKEKPLEIAARVRAYRQGLQAAKQGFSPEGEA